MTDQVPFRPLHFLPRPSLSPGVAVPSSVAPTFLLPHFHSLLCISTLTCCRDLASASAHVPSSLFPATQPLPYAPHAHLIPCVPLAQPWRLLSSPLMSLWSSLLFSWPLCMPCSHPLNPDYHHTRRMWLSFFCNVFLFFLIGVKFI